MTMALALMFVSAAEAQVAQPVAIRGESIRLACAYADSNKYQNASAKSPAGILGRFCQLPAPNIQNASSWAVTEVPPISDVEAAAAGEPLSEQEFVVEQAAPVIPSDENVLGLQEIVVGGATSFLPNEGVMLVGLAQFAVGRAKEVVSIYVVQAFAKRMCTGAISTTGPWGELTDSIRRFVPATCQLLQSGRSNELMGSRYGLPSWGIVQSALRKDLDVLPDTVFSRFRTYGAMALADTAEPQLDLDLARQRLVASLAAARFSSSYLRWADLPGAFRDAASDIAATLYVVCSVRVWDFGSDSIGACPYPWDDMPGVRNLLVTTSLLGVFEAQDFKAVLTDPAKREEIILQALKALAVNVQEDEDQPGRLRDAWKNFAAEHNLQNDSSGGPLFKADKVLALTRQVFDSLSRIEKSVAIDLAAAGNDRSKRLSAYVSGVSEAAPLLVTTLDPRLLESNATELIGFVQRVATYPELRANGRYTALLYDVMTLVGDVAGDRITTSFSRVTLPAAAVRALQFAVDAADLKDSDAFERVLVSYAAPVNGFLRKRTRLEGASKFYWSINMYVGAAYGREWAEDESLSGRVGARYSGLALPFGAEFGAKTRLGSFSALLQIIDLGQVASWRSKQEGDTTIKTTPPSLTLAGVFAPGVNAVWNWPRLPLAFGLGYVKAPQFRDIEPVDAPARKASVWRTIAFVAVDIPLIP